LEIHVNVAHCFLAIDCGRILDYLPRKEYAKHIPVSALFLFLAAPLIYAGLNGMTVPNVESIDTLRDRHTRQEGAVKMAITASSDANG
jgi:hypothetical protein